MAVLFFLGKYRCRRRCRGGQRMECINIQIRVMKINSALIYIHRFAQWCQAAAKKIEYSKITSRNMYLHVRLRRGHSGSNSYDRDGDDRGWRCVNRRIYIRKLHGCLECVIRYRYKRWVAHFSHIFRLDFGCSGIHFMCGIWHRFSCTRNFHFFWEGGGGGGGSCEITFVLQKYLNAISHKTEEKRKYRRLLLFVLVTSPSAITTAKRYLSCRLRIKSPEIFTVPYTSKWLFNWVHCNILSPTLARSLHLPLRMHVVRANQMV